MKLIIKENVNIYQCPYCKKIYLIEHYAKLHMKDCNQNPANKVMCFTCKYFEGRERSSWSWKCKNFKKKIGKGNTDKSVLVYRKSGVVCGAYRRC